VAANLEKAAREFFNTRQKARILVFNPIEEDADRPKSKDQSRLLRKIYMPGSLETKKKRGKDLVEKSPELAVRGREKREKESRKQRDMLSNNRYTVRSSCWEKLRQQRLWEKKYMGLMR